MNISTDTEPPPEVFDALQPWIESASAFATILSNSVEEMIKVQSGASAAGMAETLSSLVLPLTPDDSMHLLWQVPSLYRSQSERLLRSMLDTLGILAGTGQQVLEWQGERLSRSVQQTASAMSRLMGVLATRRVSADIINFSDRRAAAQTQWRAAEQSFAPTERKSNHRASRHATG